MPRNYDHRPTDVNLSQTPYEHYLEHVADEAAAERAALSITNELRDNVYNVYIDKDGNLTGRPSAADVGREAAAWARVAQLRVTRCPWIASNA